MSTFDYSRLKATADRLLARFGKSSPMVLLEPGANSGSSFDPVQGPPIPHSTVGVIMGYSQNAQQNPRIEADDRRALVAIGSLAGVVPKTDWLLQVAGKSYRIINIAPLEPGDVTLLWDIQCRAA
jgi:hypothetical protein